MLACFLRGRNDFTWMNGIKLEYLVLCELPAVVGRGRDVVITIVVAGY